MIKPTVTCNIKGQEFVLLHDRAAIWKDRSWLLIADIHAGKASHFRKNGIPLTGDHLLQDLNRIEALIEYHRTKKVIILGDLFHSHTNEENEFTLRWISERKLPFILIKGNHDQYSELGSLTAVSAIEEDGIRLTHEPEETDQFNIYGHLHPAFTLKGKARQFIKLPSFYLNDSFLALPSFGSTTGGKVYKDKIKDSKIYLVSARGLIEV